MGQLVAALAEGRPAAGVLVRGGADGGVLVALGLPDLRLLTAHALAFLDVQGRPILLRGSVLYLRRLQFFLGDISWEGKRKPGERRVIVKDVATPAQTRPLKLLWGHRRPCGTATRPAPRGRPQVAARRTPPAQQTPCSHGASRAGWQLPLLETSQQERTPAATSRRPLLA